MVFITADTFAEKCIYTIKRQKKGKRASTMDKN